MTRAKVILMLILILVVLGAGALGWWVWSARSRSAAAPGGGGENAPSQQVASVGAHGQAAAPVVKEAPSQADSLKSIPNPERVLFNRGNIEDPDNTNLSLADHLKAQAALESAPPDPNAVVVPDQQSGSGSVSPTPVLEGSGDPDGDGLTNDQERQQGSDPSRADTDGDGLNDGVEVRQYRSDVRKPDTDGDGLTDGEEANRWKTDPLNPDTDGDTYPDGTEVKGGYNPKGQGKL
jgi:hypothetical protein